MACMRGISQYFRHHTSVEEQGRYIEEQGLVVKKTFISYPQDAPEQGCKGWSFPWAATDPAKFPPLPVSTGSPSLEGPVSTETTLYFKVPDDYRRQDVINELKISGCKFDFVYLPFNFKKGKHNGFAFVNMINHEEAENLKEKLSSEERTVGWAADRQGKKANIDHYRNNPIMHRSVPEEYKPVIFENGARQEFPEPTIKEITLPRNQKKPRAPPDSHRPHDDENDAI